MIEFKIKNYDKYKQIYHLLMNGCPQGTYEISYTCMKSLCFNT